MHFITAIGYDSTYIYANDPNNDTVPRKQVQSKFQSCMKQAFIFWPTKAEKMSPMPTEQAAPTAQAPAQVVSGATGSAIIDISKWQGNINFDALKSEVALVIARAGCGSDPDAKFDEYAQAMQKHGIPFGVYCYSYAGTEAKARDEAQKMVARAGRYNPLFYVMDAEESKITNAAIKAFADELRIQGAERIGCYVAHNHYKDYGYDSIQKLWDFTWIPRYGSNNGTIAGSTKPAYICDLWQYASTGKVNGISGNVDMNVITGDGKSFDWFLGKGSASETTKMEPASEQSAEQKVRISGGNVNVRTLPNTSGNIIGVANNGTELPFAGNVAENGWLSVMFNGKFGWLSNKYGKLV